MALKKALILDMIAGDLGLTDKFKLAADCGFQGMEVGPTSDPAKIKALNEASEKSGVQIHSIIYGGWQAPLSVGDPELGEKYIKETIAGLQCAKDLGADALLLVPAHVTAETPYKDAYERSQERIKRLAPTAEKLGVVIAVEVVWNNFLYSPLEFARYIDEIGSPWVQAYFDVANVIAFGYSEDWIRTLGKRICKIHLKDFRRSDRAWTPLGEGDVNWPEVRKALGEIGYQGYMTTELEPGDGEYLRDISTRIDKLIG